MKGTSWVCLLLWVALSCAWGDEQVRQAQEELRRRNLYFGDVDGQASADFASALKRYQTRKGFSATGQVDEVTATSLNITPSAVTVANEGWPDMPVLKSDTARQLAETDRQRLEREAEENIDAPTPSPAPPAEQPSASQNVTADRVTRFVEQYLRDGETDNIPAQMNYFSYPVEYFDHGNVGPAFVEKDMANYCKRWPERRYTLTAPVTFAGSGNETMVEFPITFSVRNKKQAVTGRTRNIWRVRTEGDDLKIVAIREGRLRN
ncbi:MAG: peptidoglycan-binding domain-containing protein [Chthoniobacterales bacterium]